MSYQDEVLADSPTLYWRLGESSGPTAQDATANNRDGTYTGCTFSIAGALTGDADTAVTLDGIDDVVKRTDEAALTLATEGTLEIWAKRGEVGVEHTMFSKGSSTYRLLYTSGNVLELHSDGAVVVASATGTVADTDWHHIVATWSAATAIDLYIDGVNRTSGTPGAPTFSDTASDLSVGLRHNGAAPFDGTLDEAALYATALTGARVLAHYEAGTAVSDPPALSKARSSLRLA